LFITIHSYKGGTGKSLISVNLAIILASKGKNVCLLDLDLRAPSLNTTFKNKQRYWVNDYLNKVCEIDQILNDYTQKKLQGNLFVGLANPNIEAIREISSKDRKWEREALGRIINLNSLIQNRQFDYIITDTSPGLQYSSINTIVASDIALIITTEDISDIQGTQRMLTDLYDLFQKKTMIIVNKALSTQKSIKLQAKQIPIMELLPCSCDILKSKGDYLFTYKHPNHPVTKKIQKIAAKIEKLKTNQNSKHICILNQPNSKPELTQRYKPKI